MPFILFGLIWVSSPTYLPPLLDEPLGQKMLAIAGVLMVIGLFWMRKVIRIEP